MPRFMRFADNDDQPRLIDVDKIVQAYPVDLLQTRVFLLGGNAVWLNIKFDDFCHAIGTVP